MGRIIGNAIFSANFEPKIGAPLDSRFVVDYYSDLTNTATWDKGDGNAYVYKGMIVSVVNDANNNGLYILNDIDYTNSNNWKKINVNYNEQKLSFGNINIIDTRYPVTLSSSIDSQFGKRYFPQLQEHFDDYNKFLFNIYCENGDVFLEKQFVSKNDLVDFLNNNLERNNNGNEVVPYIIECYAKINSSVGNINKIYGMNLFYSVLKGRNSYKKRILTLYDGAYSTGNKIDNFKHDLVKKLWDYFTFDGFLQEYNYDAAAKSIWFPQTYSNIYNPLYSGNSITFNSSIVGNRHVFNWGDSTFHLHDGYRLKVTSSVVIGMPIDQNTFSLFRDIFFDGMYSYNYSYCRVYKLEGRDHNSDNITALFLKPIGQDTFRLNYIPNISEKDLYAYYYEGDNDHQPVVKRLNATKSNLIISDISFLVKKTDWNVRPNIGNVSTINHIGKNKIKKIRFFIGDGNGNISPLSPEITPYTNRKVNKLTTLISKI